MEEKRQRMEGLDGKAMGWPTRECSKNEGM